MVFPKSRFWSFVAIFVSVLSVFPVEQVSAKSDIFSIGEKETLAKTDSAFFKNLNNPSFRLASPFDSIEYFLINSTITFELPRHVKQEYFSVVNGGAEGAKALPDILVVLNESLFNPALLTVCDKIPALCNFEIFNNSGAFSGVHGPLFVHVHGGGTWLSEFSFLTGYDWRVFGEGGAYAPKNIVPHMNFSFAKHLKKLGYRTVAIYPVAGNFLNAREAYEKYGFDEFYATEELGITTHWQSTPDSVVFKKAMQVVRSSEDKRPIFLFILTIKNHGPHASDVSTIDNLNPKLEKYKSIIPSEVLDYLNRLYETDEAISNLKSEWLGEGNRVFAWFGDHQPKFTNEFGIRSPIPNSSVDVNNRLRFLTWYHMTSNLEGRWVSSIPEASDLAFFGTKLLNYSGVPLPDNSTAISSFAAQCPLGFALCQNEKLRESYLSFRVWELKEISSGR